MNKKKTKIVCTIGPATETEEKLTSLLNAGMNVMRLNFSHGDFNEHQARVDNIRKVMDKTGLRAAILQDLCGPKIRTGTFKTEIVTLVEGQDFTLTTDAYEGDTSKVSVNYPLLAKEVKVGETIFVDDGKKEFEVVAINGNDIQCKVIVGGELKGRRGLNLPDSDLSISALTDKDKADLEFGIKNNVDFVALSFVRRPSDVKELRDILNARKLDAKIISKIETPQALACIDEIIELSDGIMVARGDLAVEIPPEKVPMATKDLIEKCNIAGKPVIYATQVMESMIKSPVPTRAEVSDCANGIYDGTDAVMLSEESTLGKYPVHAVDMINRIAKTIESDPRYMASRNDILSTGRDSDVVMESAVAISDTLEAALTVIVTNNFFEAQSLASIKPGSHIVVATTDSKLYNQICLSFACTGLLLKKLDIDHVQSSLLENKMAEKGNKVVVLYNGQNIGDSVNSVTVKTL